MFEGEATSHRGMELNPTIPLHRTLVDREHEMLMFPDFFQNWEPRLVEDRPVHIYFERYETDRFTLIGALVADRTQSGEYLVVWEIQPHNGVRFGQYDIAFWIDFCSRQSTSEYLHALYENDPPQMIVRYTNQDQNEWLWAQSSMAVSNRWQGSVTSRFFLLDTCEIGACAQSLCKFGATKPLFASVKKDVILEAI